MEQLSLFSLEPKIESAVENLKLFERAALQMNPEGYYLAFSGGKDSQVIYHLAQMAGVKFKAYYHITTVDPPELVRFIRKEYPEVIRTKPEMSMWELILKKKYPPTRRVRYCCSELKERGGQDRFVITGVRWAESKKRKGRGLAEITGKGVPSVILLNNDNDEKRRLIENCTLKGKRVLNPIIDWTDNEVWQFIHTYIHTYCELYDCGFSRIGCIGCPLISVKRRIWELERYPKYKQAYLNSFKRLLEQRVESQEEGKRKINDQWKTAEDVYKWWLYGGEKKEEQVHGQIGMDLQTERRSEMPQREQTEIRGKSFDAWMQTFRKLSYEWEKVWKYGTADNMWADGITLNRIRQEMIQTKQILEHFGVNDGLSLPDEVPRSYMANEGEIREQAERAKQGYLQDEEYQFLCQMEPDLTNQQKDKTQIMIILGKVRNLIRAVEEDNLVVMREYGTEGQFSKQISETAKEIRRIPLTKKNVKSVRSESADNGSKEDWQLKGRMTIYDFAS